MRLSIRSSKHFKQITSHFWRYLAWAVGTKRCYANSVWSLTNQTRWHNVHYIRLITFQRAKLSTRSITHLCWCNWRTFWRKNAARSSLKGSCSCTTMSELTGHCNPEETGLPGFPVSWSPTLFCGSGPVGLPPVPWTEKTIERSPFLVQRAGHCCHGDLVGRTTIWIFFEWLAKLRATV